MVARVTVLALAAVLLLAVGFATFVGMVAH